MSRRDKLKYARGAAQRILVLQSGDMNDPETWAAVARSRGCYLSPFHEPGGSWGEYAPRDYGRGVICFNTAFSPQTQARIIVHELAHHLLMSEVPGDLFGEWVRCYYDDDPQDIRHQIARIVEQMCFNAHGED